ncbi:MAG: tetratricopeptide repeat protein [Verrucomicrobiia bacterium]
MTRKAWFLAAVLVAMVLVVYQPVWRAGFIWDDDFHVTENVNLRSVHGLYRIWFKPLASEQYYPLQLTSYWMEYHLWGLRPVGYHAANVLLHVLNALLLWIVLRQLEIPGAWVAAAIFAIHPMQVESVAWVSELKNLLSTTFYLGAMLAFFRFRPLTGQTQTGSPSWRFYSLAIALFLCALLSKTVACSLPAVLVLLIWWKRGRVEKRDIEVLSPMFLLGIPLGLMTAWLEKHHVGASGAEWSLSILQRCLLAGRASWFYAGKLFWPHPLIFIYPRWTIDPGVWWAYLFPAAALAVLLALWSLRSRIGRGPLVGALCFAGTLAPALGFFDVFPFRYSFVADHFQYLASVGIIAVAVVGGAVLYERAGSAGRTVGRAGVAVLLTALAALAWTQAHVYRDNETLWRDTVEKNPASWMAYNNLGLALHGAGNVSDAIASYRQSLRINPDNAEAHYNLGNSLLDIGKVNDAIAEYEQALRLQPDDAKAQNGLALALVRVGRTQDAISRYQRSLVTNPNHAEAHYEFANFLMQIGRVNDAIAEYEQVVRLRPDFAKGRNNLGVALTRSGKIPEAMAQYQQVLRVHPDDAEAQYNLGNAFQQLGNVPEAIGHYQEAVRLNPDHADAHNNLGNLLLQEGRVNEARVEYERAVHIRPDFAAAESNLGLALARLGKIQDAIVHYQQALRIDPNRAEAHYNLGTALEQSGNIPDAITHYREALRLDPSDADAQKNLARLQATSPPSTSVASPASQ